MLTVADVMTRRPVLAGPDDPVGAALDAMRDRGISSVLASPPAGAITYGIVSVPVTAIDPDATIEECSSRMSAEGVRRFPVREAGDLVGIISASDILAAVEGHRWWGRRGRRWPNSHIVAPCGNVPRSWPTSRRAVCSSCRKDGPSGWSAKPISCACSKSGAKRTSVAAAVLRSRRRRPATPS